MSGSPSTWSGLRVIDMACGEGYGAATLAQTAAEVIGVDANPEAFEHARLRYAAPAPALRARAGRALRRARELRRGHASCRRSSTCPTREDVLRHFRTLLAPGGAVYVSTPNLLTIAPAGRQKSDNPWHLKEYLAHEFRELCESVFDSVELYGLYHARKLRAARRWRCRSGWDRVHRSLRFTDAVLRPLHAEHPSERFHAV